jgi:ferric-dicitrate binding protein FerR (iron transport regulator)
MRRIAFLESVKLTLSVLMMFGILITSSVALSQSSIEFQKGRIEERVLQYPRKEREAQKALDQAHDALKLAERRNDLNTANISREAMRIARAALAKIRKMWARDQAQLEVIEKALRLDLKDHLAFAAKVRGKVCKKTADGLVSFDSNTPIRAGDELQTGPDGFVKMIFTEGSIIQIGPNTTFKVTQLEGERSLYEVFKGRLHGVMECMKKSRDACRRIRISSSSAVIAVRGTEFNIDASLPDTTTVIIMDGSVEITHQLLKQVVEAKKGEQVVITEKGILHEPSMITLDSVKQWWEEE